MKRKAPPDDEVTEIAEIANPSELAHCKYPQICDHTRACESYRRLGHGCGGNNVIHIWPVKPVINPSQ